MLSFHVKFVQTDRRMMVKLYTPDLSMWGHIKKKKGCLNTLTIQSFRNVNEPKKAFKVNVELFKIA